LYWSNNILDRLGTQEQNNLKSMVSDFLMFTKPYYGEMFRNGKIVKRRFYDEREWHWIPKISRKDAYIHLDKESYFDEKFRTRANSIVTEHYPLSFKPRRH